jgi:hypothetical protein
MLRATTLPQSMFIRLADAALSEQTGPRYAASRFQPCRALGLRGRAKGLVCRGAAAIASALERDRS